MLLDAFAARARRWFATLSLAAIAGSLFFLAARSARCDVRRPAGDLGADLARGDLPRRDGRLAILVAKPYLARTGEEKGEFYALLLWGHLGVSLMTRGLDLLVIFIGLELLSLSFYVLAAFFRGVHASSEAGLKYFLTGAFGSAFTLYGIALLFGKSGSMRIARCRRPGLGRDPS